MQRGKKEKKGKSRDLTCNSKVDKISLVCYTNQTKKMKTAKQKKQVVQLSQRDRGAGWVRFWPKVAEWNGETTFCGHFRLSSTTTLRWQFLYKETLSQIFFKQSAILHVVFCCYFLKMCCYRIRLVAFIDSWYFTLDISQGSVATHLKCGAIFSYNIITNVSWFWQWNNFKYRLIFGKFKAYKTMVPFFGPPCRFFGLHFCCRKYLCIFNHFHVIRSESRGVATGGVYRYIYPPKISPPKIFMGVFFFFLWGRD